MWQQPFKRRNRSLACLEPWQGRLSQSARSSLPDPTKYGLSRNQSYFVVAMEFLLTPSHFKMLANGAAGKIPIEVNKNFAFAGNERIDFEDDAQIVHFFFPKDYAWAAADSLTDYSNRVNIKRIFYSQDDKTYLLIGVPWNWMNGAPAGELIIDPTTTITNSSDVRLMDGGFYGSGASLSIGKNTGVNKSRSLVSFNVSTIPPGATVLNAQMKLYYYSGVGSTWGDRWVQAHQLYVSWAEAQANRDNRRTGFAWKVQYGKIGGGSDSLTTDANGQFESTMLFQTGQTNAWKNWDLSRLTQQWVSNTTPNLGVMLWATNEDTDYNTLWFRSSEYSNSTYWPKLEVIYSTDAAIKTVYFLKDHLGSVRATVLDSAGAPVIGYDDYDPWGYPLALRTKAIPNAYLQGASKNKFTGKESDDEYGLNLLHTLFRPYDPETGRWIGVDPLAQKYPSLSPYNYAANNPILFLDINGDSLFVRSESQAAINAFVGTSNNALGGFYTVSVGENGLVAVTATDQQGPLTPQQEAFLATLNDAILQPDRVAIGLVMNSEEVAFGSYGLQQIDMADVAKLGNGAFLSAAGALGHEIAEQTHKQLGWVPPGREGFNLAHQNAIEQSENLIQGSIRGRDYGAGVDAKFSGSYRFTYTKGTDKVHVIVTFNRANVVNVSRVNMTTLKFIK